MSTRNSESQRLPPTRATSTRGEEDNEYVAAVVQGRGQGVEMGIAVHSLETGHRTHAVRKPTDDGTLKLADTTFHYKTIHHLDLHPPCTIVVQEAPFTTGKRGHDPTSSPSDLVQALEEHFMLDCVSLPRDCWNHDRGLSYLSALGVDDNLKTSTLMACSDKYYALAATCALFQYLEAKEGLYYPDSSLKVSYIASEGTMFIDMETVRNLELVTNTLTHKSGNTLFGLLNHCATPMGSRLLRGNILLPSNVRDTIDGRLDASPDRLKAIHRGIERLGRTDLDKLINQATRKTLAPVNIGTTGERISILLQLERYVESANALKNEVAHSNCKLLVEIFEGLSDEILPDMKQLISILKEFRGGLYHCSDAIAKLDVLAAFADISQIRPVFDDTMSIKGGRHPILDKACDLGDCVPNDVYAPDFASFQLIQGPNVPAQYASFRLHDALLSRLSNDDALEKNLSTFASEMATSAMILGLATSNSLIIVDEVESLIERKAFVFFATHFHDLTTTLGDLPGVVKMHLRVENNKIIDDENAFSATFQYKVEEGQAMISHYGLELAKLAAFPQEVMVRAKEVATKLSELEERGRETDISHALVKRRKVLFELDHLLRYTKDDEKRLALKLEGIQLDCVAELKKTFSGFQSG
ncbi:uncharacterized protein IL334_003470 [Kwoniella shivajii]|uniref:DNA mismatch repair proteins mutS family domain-containing protein n=1 Tax=Kwoniella shivajii TaxID=564305 RepID=A0ABZ1CY09_9TREE|nr:hypothetical protein IL334_003470 [Kwoniella shivajii]